MSKIYLKNRDRAKLWLEQTDSDLWKLKVDPEHEYCIKYMRMGGDFEINSDHDVKWNKIAMIDPSGGPYLEIGDKLKDELKNEYEIIEMLDATLLRLKPCEGNSNK